MRRLIVLLTAIGCAPADSVDIEGGSTTDAPTSTTTTTTTTTTTSTTTSTSTSTSTSTTGSSSDGGESAYEDDGMATGCAFTCPPPGGNQGGGGQFECSPVFQDCPEGEKCMPWANDGSNIWNATRCSPVAPDADQVDEPCTVEGSTVSGVDSCALGLKCWHVDPKTNEGVCHQLCAAVPGEPTCPGDRVCSEPYGYPLPICVAPCDPLAQDCTDGDACYAAGLGYGCLPPTNSSARLGSPCEERTDCRAGSACIPADLLDECEGESCCAAYCDVDAPGCAGCTAFFEFAGAPPVGYCP